MLWCRSEGELATGGKLGMIGGRLDDVEMGGLQEQKYSVKLMTE